MHDPMTVAHEIRWPIKNKRGYRKTIMSIWHVDPESDGSDDSCGWFSPKIGDAEIEEIRKFAINHYSQIKAYTWAAQEGKDYLSVCYDQDTYGAIYWLWRALKAKGKKGWQYGKPLTGKELDYIYNLATNPVDNFQNGYHRISNLEQFQEFVLLIHRCFRRFYRPWY